jgi:hypothetical protein
MNIIKASAAAVAITLAAPAFAQDIKLANVAELSGSGATVGTNSGPLGGRTWKTSVGRSRTWSAATAR